MKNGVTWKWVAAAALAAVMAAGSAWAGGVVSRLDRIESKLDGHIEYHLGD